ncbi:MAG: thrombospondin type 3 repeat-containing protein, partial [Bradymonadaceae bacterium]
MVTGCGSSEVEDEPLIIIEDDASFGPDTDHDGQANDVDAGPLGDTDDAEIVPQPGPGDRDGDGVPDDEDNCPDIFNPDQADRDRDGLGDVCDDYPNIYDPSNPSELLITEEDPNLPNDSSTQGESYGLSLPFIIEGGLEPASSAGGDLDYYSFEIDEPTALLVHLEARGTSYWPAAIVHGYDWRNGNVQSVVVGSASGQGAVRDIFLPVPGRYSILVTDLRNLTNQPNVGGPAYDYRVSVSEVPLPDAVSLSSSGPPHSFEHLHELRVLEVDVSGQNAIVVEARGVARDSQSALLPAVAVMDKANGSVLAYTVGGQVDEASLRVELSTMLSGQDTVLVIADHVQAQGRNDMLVDVSMPVITEDLETLQVARDQRDDDLLWLVPGAGVEGVIGPPRLLSDTQLMPDTDYFLFTVRRGESYRVRVEPVGTSPVLPRVEAGIYIYDGFSSFFLANQMAS